MRGWPVPPPKPPTKTATQLALERQLKVSALEAQGLLKSERIKAALLKVPREDFAPPVGDTIQDCSSQVHPRIDR